MRQLLDPGYCLWPEPDSEYEAASRHFWPPGGRRASHLFHKSDLWALLTHTLWMVAASNFINDCESSRAIPFLLISYVNKMSRSHDPLLKFTAEILHLSCAYGWYPSISSLFEGHGFCAATHASACLVLHTFLRWVERINSSNQIRLVGRKNKGIS